MQTDFVTPGDHLALRPGEDALETGDGRRYRSSRTGSIEVVDFLAADDAAISLNERLYRGAEQNQIYRNFLDWLFRTFRTDEQSFRAGLAARLVVPAGARILVTGCGNGDDLAALIDAFGDRDIRIWAQDVSAHMVDHTARRFDGSPHVAAMSVSDACRLPHPDGFFDLAYHFGGINFMPDRAVAIAEMTRVVRDGGQVFFGDEGIAPWLRGSDYADMMIANIPVWSEEIPLPLLPRCADAVNASWILGNCFYLVDFVRNDAFPDVDIDVPHRGRRGGTIRTRYFGRVEGVSEAAKARAAAKAAERGMSISDWLTELIDRAER